MKSNIERRVGFVSVLVVSLLIVGLGTSFGQSLGEVARQQRAKQKESAKPETHVYTNGDLERTQILTPQDSTRFAAERQALKPDNSPQTASVPAPGFDNIPMGDIARHYRMLKLLEEQRDAANGAVLPGTSSVASPIIPYPTSLPLKQPDVERKLVAPRSNKVDEMKASSLPATGQVLVRKGDSLWKLAEKYLGNGTRWQAILQVNPQLRNPNLIRAGDHLRLPAATLAQAPGLDRVQKGDSLWKLAEVHFGSGACWVSIAQANPQISNPSLIVPGQQILYPEHCSSTR